MCYCHTHDEHTKHHLGSERPGQSRRTGHSRSGGGEAHTSLSDFVRRKALEAAEVEVLNRSIVTIPAKDWEAFEAWIDRPAETIPPLAELARRTPSWER